MYTVKSICLFILLAIIISCAKKENNVTELILDSRYKQIQNITTFAKCKGPKGNYTTEIKSSSDGSCFFRQVIENSNQPYTVKITSNLKGYVVDTLSVVLDTLPNNIVEMLRVHDFHRLHFNPQHFFDSITFDYHINKTMSLYRATDRLKNSVNIFYNRNTQNITKIELLNPIDTTQVIEIINKKWSDSNYGKMAKEIEIIQAKKDTFHFSFENIKIN
jgi:hypothetical protein